MTEAFVADIERFVADQGVEIVSFSKRQRKDDVTQQYLQQFDAEKACCSSGRRRRRPGRAHRTSTQRHHRDDLPLDRHGSAMVNHYYFYCVDEDFGPFFLKFCSYFPYNAKLCINGHEYVKRQLRKRGIAFEALDNGLLSCDEPGAAAHLRWAGRQEDRPLPAQMAARLPHPFHRRDRRAGYRYDVSILQAEFALTQVLDRPVTGRIFFEQVIRENLDIGRPGQVQLIFDRRMIRRTPGRFRTRVITEGVTPSLHVDYKHSRIKQYHKEGRPCAPRPPSTTRATSVSGGCKNLPELRRIGFAANRRLLDVEHISHDCQLGDEAFVQLQRLRSDRGQRASALRFGDPNAQAVLNAVLMFVFVARGFTNKDLRQQFAVLLGKRAHDISPGRMSYELRRLRLHGLIERLPKTHRYRLTDEGLRTALFYTRVYSRILRPAMAPVVPAAPAGSPQALRQFHAAEAAVNSWCDQAHIAA